MKTLFDSSTATEIRGRLASLNATHRPVWGKMSPGQAMAHCTIGLESATGDRVIKPVWIGWLLGRIVKPLALGDDKPLKRNSPTAAEFIIKGDRDVDAERAKLDAIIARFVAAGREGCTTNRHSFFGPMTPDEWGILMYKHLDHHLRQFGV